MIRKYELNLICVDGQFEYDTYLLVKEFYPDTDIVRQNVDSDAFLRDAADPVSEGRESGETDGENETEIICIYNTDTTEIRVQSGSDEKNFTFEVKIPPEDKKAYKKAHMGNLYRALSGITQITLPWGDLTGVRPTKLARQMYLKGATDEEVRDFYEKDRFVSREKSSLAMEIAKREIRVLSPLDPVKGYSLYIGIPFCPTRCLYCSFLSNPIAMWQKRIPEYLGCIEKELQFVKDAFAGRKPDTVYIGGGTPTALSAEELKILTDLVANYLNVDGLLEYTVEAGRPDSITADKLKVLKGAGVSRISVNPQTMNEETLRLIGRNHTVQQTLDSFSLAREAGFDNINMDIILGLPGEGLDHIRYTMEEIIKCAPDSLTVHSLAVKRSAGMRDFKKALKEDKTGEDGNSLTNNYFAADPAKMMEIAYAGAAELNLKPYYLYRQKNIAGNLENVGFAEEGKFGIYNILMMEEVQSIVALGAGTVSKRVLSESDIARCDTAKDIGLYMDNIGEMIERKRELFCQGSTL